MDSARDFYLLGESVLLALVSTRTLALRGLFIEFTFAPFSLSVKLMSMVPTSLQLGFERSRLGGHDMAESSQLTSHKKQI